MAFKYTSSNQESKSFHVEPGDYDVTVIEAVETISKSSGADMIKLNLEVDGHGCRLFDYLIASESTAWKIDAFRRSIGDNVVEGEEVELSASTLIGRRGRARLKTEEFNGKTNNKVDLWLEPSTKAEPAKAAPAQPEEDDNEPF
jgi:hypothetical protein